LTLSDDGDGVSWPPGNIPYTWGREARATYNESLAGARAPSWAGVDGPMHADALRADGEPLKDVYNLTDLAPPGEADDGALMAFQHRTRRQAATVLRALVPAAPTTTPTTSALIQRTLDYVNSTSPEAASFLHAHAAVILASLVAGCLCLWGRGGGGGGAQRRRGAQGMAGRGGGAGDPPSPYTHTSTYRSLPLTSGTLARRRKYCLCCGISIAASDQPTLNKKGGRTHRGTASRRSSQITFTLRLGRLV
jgi:hypothetical protein